VGLTPPLLSPESLELHAASNNAHINADKILGTAFLQAILMARGMPQAGYCYSRYATPFCAWGTCKADNLLHLSRLPMLEFKAQEWSRTGCYWLRAMGRIR
jgi:hypothetical protein